MSERMPIDNLDEFTASPHHPMATADGYLPEMQIIATGQQLRNHRTDNGLTMQDVADLTDWSQAKVMRIEGGITRPSVTDVWALLGIYNVTDDDIREPLLATVRANLKQHKPGQYTSIISPTERQYLGCEAGARHVSLYAASLMPEILQTSNFAEAFDETFYPDDQQAARALRVQLRRERAAYLLGRCGPAMQIIICEDILRRPERAVDQSMGGGHDQLRIIINALKRLNTAGQGQTEDGELNTNIAVQVVPLSLGAYPLATYSYNILDMPPSLPTTTYAQLYFNEDVFNDKPDKVIPYQEAFDDLSSKIPGPERTNDILDAILASLPS